MKRSALLLILPLLAACDVHSKSPAKGGDNVTIKADEGGNLEFNLPIVEGKMKVPAGMMHHGDIDIDGVKLMPGSTVSGFSLFAGKKGSTVHMTFKSPAAPDQVRAYYVEQFKRQGVEVALAGNTLSGKSKDGSPFTIAIAANGTGSQGRIDIQDED
jgi:hypothetical protein